MDGTGPFVMLPLLEPSGQQHHVLLMAEAEAEAFASFSDSSLNRSLGSREINTLCLVERLAKMCMYVKGHGSGERGRTRVDYTILHQF